MSVFAFGSGVLMAKPVSGALAPNPTPIQFGTLQDISLDISFDVKELYGRNSLPDAVVRGKGKIQGKAKFASLNGKLINDIFFGNALTVGQDKISIDEAGTVPAVSTFTVTAANAATFKEDLGVRNASTGLNMVRVASAPAAGQYSVVETTGVYTFASADANLAVLITYRYGSASGGNSMTVVNPLMGTAPVFSAHLFQKDQNSGLTSVTKIFSCVATKLTRATKQDDFMVPEFDFSAFADASGNVIAFNEAQ